MNQLTLAVDTAAGISIGLADGETKIDQVHESSSRMHVEQCQPMINELCARNGITTAELNRIIVGIGPGPFTGLRIGIVTAATLGYLHSLPVKGVCTLDGIALAWAKQGADQEFLVTTDARRKELYWARYQVDGGRIGEPRVSAAESLPELPTIGPGLDAYPELLGSRRPDSVGNHLDAALLAASFDHFADQGLEPLYLRKPDAKLPTTRKSALAGGRRKLPAIAGISKIGSMGVQA